MKNVLLYIIPNSKACEEAENFLRTHRVSYQTIDASKPQEARQLMEETKQLGVPVLVVDQEAVVGFEPTMYEHVLEHK